jgi:hypothetical protein
MSQVLEGVLFWVLRLLGVAGWLWLEFQHTELKERPIKLTVAKKATKTSAPPNKHI